MSKKKKEVPVKSESTIDSHNDIDKEKENLAKQQAPVARNRAILYSASQYFQP